MLRAFLEPFVVVLFLVTYNQAWQQKMYWLINLWMLAMNITILLMIARAQESELAFTFYPLGLLLGIVNKNTARMHSQIQHAETESGPQSNIVFVNLILSG